MAQNYVSDTSLLSERTEVSTTTTYDVAVFNHIEADVEEASDIVCNGGLDIGDLFVEQNETDDEEERRIARFLASGCSCKLLDDAPCSSQFSASMLQSTRDECRQLSREQLDMVVMGQLHALCRSDPLTQKNKARNSERKRTSTQFRFQGNRVCKDTFVFLHTMSSAKFNAIKKVGSRMGCIHEVDPRCSLTTPLSSRTLKMSSGTFCITQRTMLFSFLAGYPAIRGMIYSCYHHPPQNDKCGSFITVQQWQAQTRRQLGIPFFVLSGRS